MIDIIFLDVDGCLSDGGLYYFNCSEEGKKFNVKDGFGIEQWLKMGKQIAIITGKSSQIVANRAKDLKINYVYQGIKDKFAKASEILADLNLSFENAAAIGDDYNDQRLLNAVKMSFKPANAMPNLIANYTLNLRGGDGAVREMIEKIVDLDGLHQMWLEKWL
jgi:3-deoxy-D-manno-octulosonate 8-phosphate phosphatase, yrbI family